MQRRWPGASKQASKHTHARTQCSPASVGLAPIKEWAPIAFSLTFLSRYMLENVEHCGGEPEQAAILWLHMDRLSYTLKSWAESLAFMSAVYARALPETVSNRQLAVDDDSCRDKQEVRCRTCFNFSRLRYGCRRCTLAVAQHYLYEVHEDVQFSGKIYAHLKFTVYGRKQTNRHTHASCNGVPLVWGSLRLASLEPRLSVPDFVSQLRFFSKAARQNPERKAWVRGYRLAPMIPVYCHMSNCETI